MTMITTPSQQTSLEEVQAQFEQWRKSRDKRGAIPEALWKAAASLYPAYSLNRISKTLRLNHTQLKHFVKEPSPAPPMAVAEYFIDLGIAAPACKCTVEMKYPDGKCMSVQGLNSQDLMSLARLFWSQP